ncbi:MAG: hypothetical protein ACRER3_26290 [Pseudomonas fluorescens]
MTTKEAVTFHKLDLNLLAPTIQQAENGFVKPDFLKDCTVHIAISSDIQLGDSVSPSLNIEGVGRFSRTPIVVTEEHLVEGIVWQLPAYNIVATPGAAVAADYSVQKSDGSDSKSPVGRYKVK